MLEKLGLYGLEKIERAVLAGLVTGDPVLLVGSHGSGKTLLCSRLARALRANFWAYDASKAMFEDVLGFPDPGSISAGEIKYVPTPISIWGKEFVLIDELSRANPAMQNKWLEVIRSRMIMGKKIAGLQYVFAAMNPPSYIGAHPLDAALAGRFAVVVNVPEVADMGPSAVSNIVQQVSEDDAPMLASQRLDPGGLDLPEFLDSCRERMGAMSRGTKDKLSAYVMAVGRFMASREVLLDGRRLGMVWRMLQGYLAVSQELEGTDEAGLEAWEDSILDCLAGAMPFPALGENQAASCIRAAHFYAKDALHQSIDRPLFVMAKDPLAAVDDFVSKSSQIMPDELKAGLTRFLSRSKADQEPDQQAPALLAVMELARIVCEGRLEFDPDDQHRLLSSYLRLTTAREWDMDNTLRPLQEALEQDNDLGLDLINGLTCFRAAYNAAGDYSRKGHRRHGDDAIVRLAREMLAIIKMG